MRKGDKIIFIGYSLELTHDMSYEIINSYKWMSSLDNNPNKIDGVIIKNDFGFIHEYPIEYFKTIKQLRKKKMQKLINL